MSMKRLFLQVVLILLAGAQAWSGEHLGIYGADNHIDGQDLVWFFEDYKNRHPHADLNRDNAIDDGDTAAFAVRYGDIALFDFIYDVGPGRPYADPSAVPWESLQPGSLVRIHHRNQPYAHKWVIAVAGTAPAPIVVRGVSNNGRLPVITGDNAVTRLELDFWNENRSVIKIGGASRPSQIPAHIIIENLEIRSARPG